MKILLLSKKFPYPLKDGESIAIHTLGKSLAEQGCEVNLLAMNTTKHPYGGNSNIAELAHYQEVRTVNVDNKIKLWDAFTNLFSTHSYHIQRFVSPDFEKELIGWLKSTEFDVVQLETLYLAPYMPVIRKYSKAKIALRAHNVEHEIWERITSNLKSGFKQWYLRHLTNKLYNFEKAAINGPDLLLPITDRDAQRFKLMGSSVPSHVVPIGIDASSFTAANPTKLADGKGFSMAFIGSLDWMPNQEGLFWFLEHVWPLLKNAHPGLTLHIAGRNTPPKLLNLKIDGVTVHGEVPDSKAFLQAHHIMVVPLLAGSGMRAKILEGMGLGKAVITTSIGLEGIHAKHQKSVLVADTPLQFLDSLNWLAKPDSKTTTLLGQQAQAFVFDQYDSRVIARKLIAMYAQHVAQPIVS